LARARRAAEELERPLGQVKRDVAENLRSHAVSQADILEANHGKSLDFRPRRGRSFRFAARSRPSIAMVNARLMSTEAGGRGSEALIICRYPGHEPHGRASWTGIAKGRPAAWIMTTGHARFPAKSCPAAS